MKTIFKELFKSIGLGLIIFFVLLVVRLATGAAITIDYALFVNFLYTMLYSITLYMANMLVFLGLDRFWKGNRVSLKRLATGFAVSLILSLLIILLLRIFEDIAIEGQSWQEFWAEETLAEYYVAMIITIVITFVIHAFYFYKSYQENKVNQQKIIAGTASAKYESLKNQIDPHFLFNSLNVLSSLIEENPENAQRFTTSLSKVYRYVLEQRDKELVSVEEELAFAKTYMNLLKMRFENSVFYEMPEKLPDPEAKVVPLSLQLLLENTIKHNIVSQQKPLHIRIYEEKGYLIVQNDFQKKEIMQGRRGVGLQNIISRYAIITNRKVLVEQTEKYFTVKLPVLTKQVTIMEPLYTPNESENAYLRAQKKVEDIKGFYGNLFSYILINTGLAIFNAIVSPQYWWFLYSAVGWGIGVVIHGLTVFNFMPFLGSDWEDRKIRELIEKEQNNKWK
ncbi:histidine kinase [Flavobacterium rhizosphaerae]|uniref:Histidine kinase n=1 Tax=Flavobacterium rhizosphaerae TaxID=3163298 RepID=A0ABW8YYR5_9FLAO